MDPKIWGPHAWFFLHTVTFSYSDNPTQTDRYEMKSFFNNFSNIIPCIVCKSHFKQNMEKYPIENFLDSRDDLVNWLINLHNIVNIKLGKPIYNNLEIINQYNSIYTKKYNKDPFFVCNNLIYFLIGIIIIINIILIIYLFIKRFKHFRNLFKKLK